MSSNDRAGSAALALLSTAMLAYEVVQIRTFSFSLHPLVAFSAISIAMLGMGLGSILPGVFPNYSQGRRTIGLAALGLGLSIVASNLIFAHGSSNIVMHDTLQVRPLWLLLVLLPAVIPYIFCGLCITLLLQQAGISTGKRYFWNLVGSALGCVVVGVMLRPLGAERIVMGSAVLACAVGAGLLLGPKEAEEKNERLIGWVSAALALLFCAFLPFASSVLPYQPDANELIYKEASEGRDHVAREHTQWDPVGRIDVLKHGPEQILVPEPVAFRSITNDSGAMTLLIEEPPLPGWGKAIFEDSIYSIAYRARGGKPEVLVIGVGGGTDIQTALRWDASTITGVEISLSSLDLVTGPYAKFAGWPLRTDRVRTVHGDGRSFAKSTSQRFDVVQMSGVDTITMHSASAMVTAEDRLYTTEAFVDFLSLLKPGGIFAVIRFGDEAINLSAIASTALRKFGITEPGRHIIAARQAWMSGILVQREAFSQEQIASVLKIEDRRQASHVSIPHYDSVGVRLADPVEILHPVGRVPDARYVQFFNLVDKSTELALAKVSSPFVVPVDDRPYYMLGIWQSMQGPSKALMIRHVWANLFIALMSLLLIVIPVFAVKKRLAVGGGMVARVVAYFFALGAGFMLLEVGIIHRIIVFVGSPGAAVSVVLGSILFSSGLGSRVSDSNSMPDRRRILVALLGLTTIGGIYIFGLDLILNKLYGLPIWGRSLSAAMILLPAGFFMGWFFPVGLRATVKRHAGLVPWAIGVNGFASVLGSLIMLPIGMIFGFRVVFILALVIYWIAGLVYLGGMQGKAGPTEAEAEHA